MEYAGWFFVIVGCGLVLGSVVLRPELLVPRCPACARPDDGASDAEPWVFFEWDSGWQMVRCAQCMRRRHLASSDLGLAENDETSSLSRRAE